MTLMAAGSAQISWPMSNTVLSSPIFSCALFLLCNVHSEP